jgi:hypothetical protein
LLRTLTSFYGGWKASAYRLHGGDQFWNVDFDEGALAGAAFDLKVKIGAVEDAEAFADVAEADTFDINVGHFFFGDADAVVFDFDVEAAVAVGGAELDFSAVEFGSEAVLEAIFDHGLQEHAGDESFESFFVDVFDDVEVVAAEAGDFDIEIVVDEFELFAQGHKGFVLAQEAAKDVAELEDDFAGVIGVEANERGDGIERVEKEVGIDLAGEGIHAGFEQELLVALKIHLDARVVPDFERCGDGHERGDDGQDEPPVPLGVNGEEPVGLSGEPESNAAQFQANADAERRHFPGKLGFFQEANDRFRNVQKGEGAEVPEIFLIGNGLADQTAEQAGGGSGRHGEPLVRDQRGNGDNRAADGADDAAAEQTHQKSTFEREIGELIGIADEAEGNAEDKRRRHEKHELEFLIGIALFGEENAAESVPAGEECGDGGGYADLEEQGEEEVANLGGGVHGSLRGPIR